MNVMKRCLGNLTCGLLALGLIACGGKETVNADKAVNVRLMEVGVVSGDYEREYIGTVEGANSVDLSFQVSGNINKLLVDEGQSIQKGQLLAALDPNLYQNAYHSAKAEMEQAEDAFGRLSKLYQSKSLPEAKYVEAKTAVDRARSQAQTVMKNLRDCNLYAPFSGVIGQRKQDIGANVMPGMPVLSLMNISLVKIKVAIPEGEISSVKVGDRFFIKISALNDASFEGRVVEKGVIAHPISHTYDVKVELRNPKGIIMPGMVCKAYLSVSTVGEGIIVPLKAVQIDFSGKNFIWIVNSCGRAVYREVVVGDIVRNSIEVKRGLAVGDKVVIEGYQSLSPGILVKSNDKLEQ